MNPMEMSNISSSPVWSSTIFCTRQKKTSLYASYLLFRQFWEFEVGKYFTFSKQISKINKKKKIKLKYINSTEEN